MAAWPAELEELIGLPPFAECLISLEISSLQDFAETFDAEEGHDKLLREALAGLPDKPKKKRIVKARSNNALTGLLARLAVFEEFDADGDGVLSPEEVAQIPPDRVVPKAGGTMAEAFDSMDTEKNGHLSFFEFFEGVDKREASKAGGGGGGSTLMRSASDAAMLATNFQNLEPEVRKKEVGAALQGHKPDHWTLGEPLGKGGQGLVFRAASEAGSVHHAVKVVPYSNVEHMKKLEREAAFLEKSSDENVISCFRHWCHSFTASKECAPLPPRPLRVRVASAPPSRGLRAG